MLNKLQLTQQLVSQFDTDMWTVDDAMKFWWQNPKAGWRLSAVGLKAFNQCKIESWTFDVPNLVLSPSLLLALDRKTNKSILYSTSKKSQLCFFNSKEATVYALYGDIKKFINGLG